MARILIMADSTCDLPPDLVHRFNIRIVPTYVQFGLESLADDGIQLTRTNFYKRLVTASPLPTTSAPSLGETIEIMNRALQDADFVIGLTAPSNLSAIYNVFRLAASQTAPERVTVIDSRTLSMGFGWQVIMAAEMAEAGHSAQAIRQMLLSTQPRIHVWAALDTLEYVRRSGRVGWAAATMGELLQIKPIVHLYDGEVGYAMRVRTSHRAFQALVDLAHQAAPLDRLAIMHTANPDGAQRLSDVLHTIQPAANPVIVEATPIIGVHVGPNGLGLAVVQKA